MDRFAGGIGLRRGRRHPVDIQTGDALDFWRVLDVNPPNHLLLHAEMKLPGDAVLEFRLNPLGAGESEIIELSRFLPRGLFGLIYWYALYPLHQLIFKGMLGEIARRSEGALVRGPERYHSVKNACRI